MTHQFNIPMALIMNHVVRAGWTKSVRVRPERRLAKLRHGLNGSQYAVFTCIIAILSLSARDLKGQTTTQTTGAISPISLPLGEMAQVTITNSCTSAEAWGSIYIDGSSAGGFTIGTNGYLIMAGVGSTLPLGHHILTVGYGGNASCAPSTSPEVGFDVVPNSLPVPQVIANVSPVQVPAGEYGTISGTVSCNTACGDGYILIDDKYAGAASLDGNGNFGYGTNPSLEIGHHTLVFQYFGNQSYAPAKSPPFAFEVIANTLPVPIVTTTVTPSPVAPGQVAAINVFVACHSACGSGVVLVDGAYDCSIVLDGDGRGAGPTSPSLAAGHHTVTFQYQGNASYAPSISPPLDFEVRVPGPKIAMTVSPLQLPAGEAGTIAITGVCHGSCGGAQAFIDGTYANGFIFDNQGNASTGTGNSLTIGHHIVTVRYYGNETDAPSSSDPIGFDVITNTLPIPAITTQIVPSPVPAGEYGAITVHVDCNSACGTGQLFVDGAYASGLTVDGSGSALASVSPSLAVGHHTLSFNYFGNLSYAPSSSLPLSFDVVPNNLPVPAVTVNVTPAQIPFGGFSQLTLSVACGSACGSGYLYIDGAYAGAITLDDAGTAAGSFSPQIVVGHHTVSFNYFGNAAYAPASSTPVGFDILPNGSQVNDAGSVTLTVNGFSESVLYSSSLNPSASAVASALASAFTFNSSSSVTVVANGATLSLVAKQPGVASDYPFTLTTTYDSQNFTQPSFSANPASGSLTGGVDTGGTSSTVYSYSVPASGGYAPNGNVLAFTDSVMGSWSLGYDSLDRLTAASITPSISQIGYYCWSYDPVGNRKEQTGSNQAFQTTSDGSCQPAPSASVTSTFASFNSFNQISSTNANGTVIAPTYDFGGNITADSKNSYLYDGDGRVCAVGSQMFTGGVMMIQYLYDASGQRVGKGTISTWSCDVSTNGFIPTNVYILGPSGEQMTELDGAGNWKHTNVFANGSLFATYDPQGLHFHLADPLESRRAQTNYAGALEATYQSLPFGDGMLPPFSGDPTEQHFTGKERDTESGLDYFGARYYASSMGRFMSPDSYGGRLADPQSLNKYAYARNNPLIYVDPDGHDFNLTGCGTTNTATCNNNMVGTTSTDGKNTFTATVISNGANGLQDQAGNAYSGTVTSAGVSFSQNGSNTSYGGSWINGSNDTSFSQTGGALNGFSFNFSQPNTATGQTLAGTFSYGDNMSASQARKALEAAGFSHSYYDAIANPLHGYDVTHYRGGGDPKTGAGAAHFILDDPYKVDDGFVMGPVRTGDFHYGETDPRVAPIQHIIHDVIPSFTTPH